MNKNITMLDLVRIVLTQVSNRRSIHPGLIDRPTRSIDWLLRWTAGDGAQLMEVADVEAVTPAEVVESPPPDDVVQDVRRLHQRPRFDDFVGRVRGHRSLAELNKCGTGDNV